MLLADRLAQILWDPTFPLGGVSESTARSAVGGAVLVELAAMQRVVMTKTLVWKVAVTDASPTGDPILDDALTRLAQRRRQRVTKAIRTLGAGLSGRLVARLLESGALQPRDPSIKPTRRAALLGLWSEADSVTVSPSVRSILVDGRPPQPVEAALIGLLDAISAVTIVVPDSGLETRVLRGRARAIAPRDPASAAVFAALGSSGGSGLPDLSWLN